MKKLILLLFIPFVCFSQTYEELMSINSVDMLKKVSIENGYQPYAENDESVFYGFNIVKDSIEDKMNKALIYDKKQDMFMFSVYKEISFFGVKTSIDETEYDLIVDKIKNKCTYHKIIKKDSGYNFVTYSCSDSSFKGKIGFAIIDGFGFILNFPEE